MTSYDLMMQEFSPPGATATTSCTAKPPPENMVSTSGELFCVKITTKISPQAQTSSSSLMKSPAQRLRNIHKLGYFFKEGLLEASRKRRKLRYNKKADKIMQEAVESAGKYFFPKSGMF